jgi:serine protease DegQ
VRAGDILFAVGDKELTDSTSMLEAIAALPPSKLAVLHLLRNQNELVAQVKVGKRPKPQTKN